MKNLSIFDVQDINQTLVEKKFDYILKLKDVCGNQAISLVCTGKEADILELCDVINDVLKNKFITVHPGKINPWQLQIH